MKRIALIGLTLALGVGAGSAGATVLFGPKGEFSSFLGSLEYDPSRSCYKPHKPFSDDEFARDQYYSGARRYLQCLEYNSNADVKYASEVVADGYKKATDDFLAEVRRSY